MITSTMIKSIQVNMSRIVSFRRKLVEKTLIRYKIEKLTACGILPQSTRKKI